MACRLSCVTGDGGGSCGNCGVVREYNGLCARCLKLSECKSCHRRLSENCFNGGQRHICEVPRPGLRCFTNRIIFYKSLSHLFSILHTLRVFSYACHRTVKNDVPYDAPLSITSCLKLRYPWPNTTHPSKRLSTHVNMPSRTSFETPYNSTGTNAFVLL